MTNDRLRLLVLYPDLLNIYADRGNILFLRRRCEWRGIRFDIVPCGIGDSWPREEPDLVYIGGGQDREQGLCAADLAGAKADLLKDWFGSGRPLLAVCGGYQLLGRSYETSTGLIAGSGAADLETTAGSSRLIGPIAVLTGLAEPTGGGLLAGFENHAGRTRLGPSAAPLGRVIAGHGNDGESGHEGTINGAAIGTYLHGPLLPKNWWLADWLIAASLDRAPGDLPRLDDSAERAAHRSALAAAGCSE